MDDAYATEGVEFLILASCHENITSDVLAEGLSRGAITTGLG